MSPQPYCSSCKTNVSCIWRNKKPNTYVCNSCFIKNNNDDSSQTQSQTSSNGNGKSGGQASNANGSVSGKNQGPRRPGRPVKKMRYKQIVNAAKVQATKGKNRRVIFKKNPLKSPESVATVVTSGSVFHQGTYFQVGDIVSLLDVDGGIYYAQLQGFMQDQYAQKSAIITWLLPTQATNKDKFDPATYILGPSEEFPRLLEFMEFVCHAPSDYFRLVKSPYPVVPVREEPGFMWSSVLRNGHPSTAQIFGGES